MAHGVGRPEKIAQVQYDLVVAAKAVQLQKNALGPERTPEEYIELAKSMLQRHYTPTNKTIYRGSAWSRGWQQFGDIMTPGQPWGEITDPVKLQKERDRLRAQLYATQDYRDEQARARAATSPTYQVSPDWVSTSADELELKWLHSLQMQKAYELFKKAYLDDEELTTKEGKKFKLKKHIEEATEKRFREGGGGGKIEQWDQIENALGPHSNTKKMGTNWLRSHTNYRRFGLMVGYNMASLPEFESVWNADGDKEEKYGPGLGTGDVFTSLKWYQLKVPEGQQALDQIEFEELQRKSDPRWKSGAKGTPEPGIQVGGKDKWRERIKRGGSTPIGGRLSHHLHMSRTRRFFKGTGRDATGLGEFRNLPWSFPLMLQASLGEDRKRFYTPEGAHAEVYDNDDEYGHFLSPAIMFYYSLQKKDKNIQSYFSINARRRLKEKADPFIDEFQRLVSAFGQDKDYMKLSDEWRPWKDARLNDMIYESYGYGLNALRHHVLDKYTQPDPLPDSRRLDRDNETFDIPDKLVIYPTLPLESFFPRTEQQPGMEDYNVKENARFYRGRALGLGHGRYLGTDVTDADIATLNETWSGVNNENIRDAWRELFEELESGDGALSELADKIDYIVLARKDGNVTNTFGDGDPGSDEYNRDLIDNYYETILDWFGAGFLDAPTTVQSRMSDEAGGGDYDIEDIDEELKKNILNYRVLKPFDFQCFLMENIDRVSEFQQRQGYYKNVVRVSCPGGSPYESDPADVISTIQRGGHGDAIDLLLNLSPAVYGLLVPYIKLYRVDYDSTNPTVAIAQQPIPIPNFVDPEDINALTAAGAGRVQGWGLQSFNWGLDGVQPETVDNNISATLTCYFQSLQDFFQGSQYAGAPTPTPLDLLISPRTAAVVGGEGAGDPGRTPPINQPVPACAGILKDNIAQEYDGAYYRIKVVSGWATPPGLQNLLPEWEPDEISLLEQAIDTTRTVLYLQQTRHEINMNQDGSVNLSIQYQAALTGMLTSNRADILGANDVASRAALVKLEGKLTGEREVMARWKAAATAKGAEVDKGRLKEQRKVIAELLEEKKAIVNQDRLKKYARFLAPLYGRTAEPGGALIQGAEPSKIYALEVNAEELLQKPMYEMDFEERAAKARQRMGSDSGYAMTSTTNKNTDLLEIIAAAVLEEGSDLEAKAISKKFAGQWKVALGKADNIYIPYFYLGDLVDLILESNADLGSASEGTCKYMTLLADIDVINPLVLYQSQNAEEITCSSSLIDDAALVQQLREKGYGFTGGLSKRINLGSIPISLDAFNVWFKDNVIKKERNTYYLIHFLKDICSQLIGVALKNACFGDNIINNIRFDTSTIQFFNPERVNVYPATKTGEGPKTVRIDKLADACGLVHDNNGIPPVLTKAEDKKAFDITQGLLVYSTDARPTTRTGVDGKAQDEAVGIYHNYLGAASGLVKSISFNRVDQPYLREAKIQKFGNLGAQQLRELYSANVEMIGNGLYKNGQYMFIWPGFIGADDKMARLLGLGGYFLVTGVNHTIDSSGYNVSVTALQEGIAFSGEAPIIAAAGDLDIPINERPSPPVTKAETSSRDRSSGKPTRKKRTKEEELAHWLQSAEAKSWQLVDQIASQERFLRPYWAADSTSQSAEVVQDQYEHNVATLATLHELYAEKLVLFEAETGQLWSDVN